MASGEHRKLSKLGSAENGFGAPSISKLRRSLHKLFMIIRVKKFSPLANSEKIFFLNLKCSVDSLHF